MKVEVLLVAVLLSGGVLTAPVREEPNSLQGEGQRCNALSSDGGQKCDGAQDSDDDIIQDLAESLRFILIMKNDDTMDKVKTLFTLPQNAVKLCIRVNYELKCSEQQCQIANMNCSDGYNFTVIWTSIDPSSLSGSFLLEFASLNWEFLGFHWAKACDVSSESAQLLTIDAYNELNVLCSVDDGPKIVNQSLKILTKHLPRFGNNSKTLGSYTFGVDGTIWVYIVMAPFVASFLSVVIIVTFFPIVQMKIESNAGKKPKAYFQFWASQVLILALGVWTVIRSSFYNSNGSIDSDDNPNNGMFFNVLIPSFLIAPLLVPYFLYRTDMNTPTQCCCCKHFCHVGVTCLSIIITSFFISIFIISVPSIILIYYLFPVQTLIRLPFVINSVLYVNSVSALLLFQVEKCFYQCTPKSETPGEGSCKRCRICVSPKHKERALDHNDYYAEYPKCCGIKDCHGLQNVIRHFMQLIATTLLLVILVLFIVMLSHLLSFDRSGFTDKNQVDLLFMLVPTVALLFGSIYKLDFFFKGGANFFSRENGKSKEHDDSILNATRCLLEESASSN